MYGVVVPPFQATGTKWIDQKITSVSTQTPPRFCPGPAGGLTAPPLPPNSQLIIAIAAQSFSQNSKKKRPANFSSFQPLNTVARSGLVPLVANWNC